jgi:hypothetical protein
LARLANMGHRVHPVDASTRVVGEARRRNLSLAHPIELLTVADAIEHATSNDAFRVVRFAVDLEREARILALVREINPAASTGAVDKRQLRLDLADSVPQQREQELIDEQPFAVLRRVPKRS